jgi:hypothetical protein
MRKRQRHAMRRPRVGPFPKLSQIRCFYSFSRFRRVHRAWRCRFRGGRDMPMGGGEGGTNGCVVGGGVLGVSGSQKPKFSSIWVEKRLRNGSETARGTAEFRPKSRPALLPEVMNDRGELHCHRTRHRGGRALPVPGCPLGRFPRCSIPSTAPHARDPSISLYDGILEYIAEKQIAFGLGRVHHDTSGA